MYCNPPYGREIGEWVKKAYEELENRGAINTISTKGTFVADKTDVIVRKVIEEKIEVIKREVKELSKLGVKMEEIVEKIK